MLKQFLLFIVLFSIALLTIGQPIPKDTARAETPSKEDTAKIDFEEMKHMGHLFNSQRFLMGDEKISGDLTYNFNRVLISDNGQKEFYRHALGFSFRVRFYEYFGINTTFFKNFVPEARARWTPDFNYAFGRFNWKPNVFNYGYENYSNNFYKDDWESFWDKFLDGYLFVSYQHYLPKKWMEKIRLDKTSSFMIMYFARYAPRYRNRNEEQSEGFFNGKPFFSIAARYTIWKRIYVEGSVNQYVNPELQKMPWDPDFTYGFGYFDWRSFRLYFSYGNYSVNRFPWNRKEIPGYGFLDGTFTLGINYIW